MSGVENENPGGKLAERLYDTLVEDNDDEGRVCRDIPDEACNEQPYAFSLQLVAQILTKIADAMASPRLVLAWMLSVAGAPGIFIALLVPVRESFSLIPQLFIARYLRERPVRKTFWVAGAMGQGLALAGMIPAFILFDGLMTGVLVIALLFFFSVCRAVNSITSKDVLGKTISKTRCGRLNGLAASAAGVVTIVAAGALISAGKVAPDDPVIMFTVLLAAGALLWFASAAVYSRVPEIPGATEGGGNAFREALDHFSLLRSDHVLRQFVIARSLMVSAGISIPYIVYLMQQHQEAGFGDLGTLMLAEGLAAMLSGHFWGKWSDIAAHRVMAAAAGLSALLLTIVVAVQLLDDDLLGFAPLAGLILFIAATSHQGIRVARKTYLVDVATSDNRARYTAISNTVIGLVVACTGLFGAVDTFYGTTTVLALLAALCLAGACLALRLPQTDL